MWAVGARERVRAGRAREVVEAQPQHDRAADAPRASLIRRVTRSTRPIATASISAGDLGERPSARCEPIEPAPSPGWTGRGSRLWASACRWRPCARPSIASSASSASAASWPTVRIPRRAELLGRHGADTPEPLDRKRVEERELSVRRDEQQSVGLRDGARDLREELRPGDADRDRQTDALAHRAS